MSGTNAKLITVVLNSDGTGSKVLEMLRGEMGLCSCSTQTARGCGRANEAQFSVEIEKDILSVAVDAERAEEAFSRIYEFVDMANRPGGFMFQAALGRVHTLAVPEQPA